VDCVGVFLPLAVSVAVAASPAALPRFVISLEKGRPGKVTVRIENVSHQPLALDARTYLALVKDDTPEGPQVPRYWAEVNAPGLPTASTPMRLAGRKKMSVPLDLRAVLWAPDRTGLSAGHTLARGVRPGEYELQVVIIDERGAWWRSGGVPMKVLQGGGIAF
jgi:hypothetical protein